MVYGVSLAFGNIYLVIQWLHLMPVAWVVLLQSWPFYSPAVPFNNNKNADDTFESLLNQTALNFVPYMVQLTVNIGSRKGLVPNSWHTVTIVGLSQMVSLSQLE